MVAKSGQSLRTCVCPICGSYASKMLTKVEKHLESEHKSSLQEEWNKINDGPALCKCGCGEVTRWINWWDGYSEFKLGHNGNVHAAYDPSFAKEILKKRSQSLMNKTSWAKNLTKDSDDRIRRRAEKTSISRKKLFNEGELQVWNRGKTKDSDDRILKAATQQKESFESGTLRPWLKGLTKESDERVAKLSQKLKLKMKESKLREMLDDLKRLSSEEIKNRIENEGSTFQVLSSLENYKNDHVPNILVKCTKCGKEFVDNLRRLQKQRCYWCFPSGSQAQLEIYNFIKTLKPDVLLNDRKQIGLEIDIFVPSANVGIEFNGLYWHCVLNKSSEYHQDKTNRCSKLGIRLMHIFDDEWREKRDIVESMIKHRLGITDRKINARQCKVVELTSNERKIFFDKNHLDGDVFAPVAIGLKLEDEIVSAISLRNAFHKKHADSIEIARFASVLNTRVRGGLSKLLAAAKNWASKNSKKKIMTYVDTRLGAGTSYVNAGFRSVKHTTMRWWWTDFEKRYNRFKFRANKEENKTEADVAKEVGVVKIWGCSNLLLEADVL